MTARFENIEYDLLRCIGFAKFHICAAVAWVTNANIVSALEKKAREGVVVELIVSSDDSNNMDLLNRIQFAGGYVYVHTVKSLNGKNLMHNKFAVFDHLLVVTGSYNWSYNAEFNKENVVFIQNEETVGEFITQFEILRAEADKLQDPFCPNALNMVFTCQNQDVPYGFNANFFWKVEDADKVYFWGSEQLLPLTGSSSIEIKADKIVTLVAEKDAVKTIKTIAVKVIHNPTCEFSASRELVVAGEPVDLNWSTQYATNVSIQPGIGNVAPFGKITLFPKNNTAYTINVESLYFSFSRQIIIKVYPVPAIERIALPKLSFSLSTVTEMQNIVFVPDGNDGMDSRQIRLPRIKQMASLRKMNEQVATDVDDNVNKRKTIRSLIMEKANIIKNKINRLTIKTSIL
jgi:hypothetical protein